jgi:hypothetical protein
MNQSQRTFLIKKIQDNEKVQVDALRNSIPKEPSLSNYILHAVMSGTFEIVSQAQIKEIIRQKALKSSERDDWMGNSWHNASKKGIVFNADELFVVPEEYKKLAKEYRDACQEINTKIGTIHKQVEGLVTRIQLASDKTLQTMINEVDDMGNISLFDTKLKELMQ